MLGVWVFFLFHFFKVGCVVFCYIFVLPFFGCVGVFFTFFFFLFLGWVCGLSFTSFFSTFLGFGCVGVGKYSPMKVLQFVRHAAVCGRQRGRIFRQNFYNLFQFLPPPGYQHPAKFFYVLNNKKCGNGNTG